MIQLLIALLGAGGSVGFGSLIKIVSGIFDSRSKNSEADTLTKQLHALQNTKLTDKQFELLFGGTEEERMFAKFTRRIVAIIGMLTFSAVTILCTLYPGCVITTLRPKEFAPLFKLLNGWLISFPVGSNITVDVTSGHVTLMAMSTLGMIFGFYFTGRK